METSRRKFVKTVAMAPALAGAIEEVAGKESPVREEESSPNVGQIAPTTPFNQGLLNAWIDERRRG